LTQQDAIAKNLERNRKGAVSRIEHSRLGIERHVGSQSQLPWLVLGASAKEITHAGDRVRPDAVGRMHQRFREEFVFVDQFQPRENVIALAEIQRGLEQIAVQVRVRRNLANPSPH
jgi:hypothetical protein